MGRSLAPLQHLQPATRGAIPTWRSTPTLRQPNPTFEHEAEHDSDAPCEELGTNTPYQRAIVFENDDENDFLQRCPSWLLDCGSQLLLLHAWSSQGLPPSSLSQNYGGQDGPTS